MSLIMRILSFFGLAFILSFLLTPLVKFVGFNIDAYAVENNRTVHHGKIVRIGGLGIFIAFMITMALMVRPDKTFNAIVVGGFIVFMAGLLDDIYNLKPSVKFLFQLLGALYVVYFGDISLNVINLPVGQIDISVFSFAISVFWIVGVTNAINLIDGLDGLSCGISFIVLAVIGFIGYFMNRIDVSMVCLILCGAIGGFLPFNFHPASIFVGDSGALFIGYMIACLSLLGFKASTFITLGFPIIILFVPLSDTCLAIIRRKLKGQKISEADRSHLHHVLMYKIGLGHRNTVLVLYLVTLSFAFCAVCLFFEWSFAYVLLFILCFVCWIFIELTGMINPAFHPLIGLCRKLTGRPRLSDDAFFEANKTYHRD